MSTLYKKYKIVSFYIFIIAIILGISLLFTGSESQLGYIIWIAFLTALSLVCVILLIELFK